MAGLTLVIGPNAAASARMLRSTASSSLPAVQSWQIVDQIDSPCTCAFVVSHPGDTHRALRSNGYQIIVEGFVDLDDAALAALASFLGHDGESGGSGDQFERLGETDGEFVLVVHREADDRTWILTDKYGHLPLYVARHGADTLYTRVFDTACRFCPSAEPNPLEVAAFLALTFVPLNGTLHPSVACLDAGSVVDHRADGTIRNVRWVCWEDAVADTEMDGRCDPAEAASALVAATQRRIDQSVGRNVMSLSGGFDSRAVISALRRTKGGAVEAITFADREGAARADVRTAQSITSVVGMPWTLIDLPSPTAADEEELFRMKRGMNALRMAFIVPFLRQIVEDCGRDVTYFTGDTGLAFRSLAPARACSSPESFLSLFWSVSGRYHRHSVYHPTAACEAAGVSRGEFDEWLVELIRERFPNVSWSQRFSLFTFDGYGRRWHYEGMDRNRQYVRVGAPLEATPVLNLALAVSNDRKAGFSYYFDVLKALDCELAAIPKAGERYAPDSHRIRAEVRVTRWFQGLPQGIVDRIRSVRGKGLHVADPANFPIADLRGRWSSSAGAQSAVGWDALSSNCDSDRCYSAALSLVRFWEYLDAL